jgi:hypothetical protein
LIDARRDEGLSDNCCHGGADPEIARENYSTLSRADGVVRARRPKIENLKIMKFEKSSM